MSRAPDSSLADSDQIIADLRRQLDERTAERDEALVRLAATTELLGIINASPGDLAPIFDEMLERALRLCDAAFGALGRWHADRFEFVATHGSPGLDYLTANALSPPGSRAGYARIARADGFVQVADISTSNLYASGDPMVRAAVDIGGARTTVTVPLANGDQVLGLLIVHRNEVRPFSDRQIALVRNFAAQAVIAMENARLITETREALEQQTATAEVLGVINSSPGDLAPVFGAILEKAHSLCGVEYGALQLYDGKEFTAAATRGYPDGFEGVLRRPYAPAPNSPLRALLDGAPQVEISDVAEHNAGAPNPRAEAAILIGIRSVLFLPLRRDHLLLGLISAARKEPGRFTDEQIALLKNFAAQAVIAMENARLLGETLEALEQQTATAEVLGVINASPGDLTPVFDAMLEKALSLCDAAFGSLRTYDGEALHTVASRNLPPRFADYWKQPIRPDYEKSAIGHALRERRTVHVPDNADTDGYRQRTPVAVAAVELGGIRTVVHVPLIKDNAVLGVLTAFRLEVRPFTDKQVALLQNFAAQAVIAMENARLIAETREALEQQTATAEVLGVINSSPGDLAPVFDAMLEKARALGGAAFGTFMLREDDRFFAVAVHGAVPEPFARILREGFVPSPVSPVGRLRAGEPLVHIHDLAAMLPAMADDPVPRTAVEIGGVRTLLMVPLVQDAQLVGLFTNFRQEVRPFSDKQIALLQNFAAQAVVAMENARLLGELRQSTDEVADLNRGLEARVAEQVDELARVGRLKRFLAPQLAEMIVSQGDEKILESHRREIVVVFCDLRGYTAFTETAEPEEVLDFLREYHGALGPLVSQFEGTLDQFSGDGIMVFFNDPVPIPDPAERAVTMATAMREAAGALISDWRERGRELGFGVGIAQGYATLGQIGFSERSGYTAIGTVCNVAARLCAEAKDGQILLSQRVNVELKGSVVTEQLAALTLKGLTQPVIAYNVPLVGAQPALRVIEGGPPTE